LSNTSRTLGFNIIFLSLSLTMYLYIATVSASPLNACRAT